MLIELARPILVNLLERSITDLKSYGLHRYVREELLKKLGHFNAKYYYPIFVSYNSYTNRARTKVTEKTKRYLGQIHFYDEDSDFYDDSGKKYWFLAAYPQIFPTRDSEWDG